MNRRRRLPYALVTENAFPQMNTTPLIDVMLVMLILCIVSIPMATHKVAIDLPNGPPITNQDPIVYRLAMDDAGRLRWDGAPVTLAALPGRLAALQRNPDSQLEIETSGDARYEDFDRMLAVVKRAKVERLGFVGQHAFARDMDR